MIIPSFKPFVDNAPKINEQEQHLLALQRTLQAKETRFYKICQQSRLKSNHERKEKAALETEIEALKVEINIAKLRQREW